jgi:signal transduction histidine kinase
VGIMDLREDVAQAIESAKLDLDRALFELDRIPALDPAALAFVAHSMSNYLHVSEALLNLLRNSLRDYPDPEIKVWLDGLHHVSDLAHQTVARLLRVYEPSQMPLKLEYFRLERLIERACAYHRQGADQKNVEIFCIYTGEVPEVWADRVGVAVVADNLLSNAVKFSHPGGRIDVTIAAGAGGVVCSVRDYGPGLTPLTQATIFERGRVGQPPLGDEQPTGHGLLVAKAFVDRMGGRLWSESEAGKGACFSFRLPYGSRDQQRYS